MTGRLLEVPANVRHSLAQALATGLLGVDSPEAALRSVLALGPEAAATSAVAYVLAEMRQLGVSGRAAAAWIRAVDDAATRAPTVDLVWSGPDVPGVFARDTGLVLKELISAAERTIWASTYVYYDGQSVFADFAKRFEQRPALKVTLLLNIRRKWGDATPGDVLVRRFAERFWTKDWPARERPRVYYDPRSVDKDGPGGVLHAKAVVVDEEVAFVTSANLTQAAQDDNFELGLLVRDKALAASIASHFQVLVDQRQLHPLPE